MPADHAEHPQAQVDARGRPCPEPVLALRAALRALEPGAVVELLATDPLAPVDVQAYCLRAGHELLREAHGVDGMRFLVRGGPRAT